MKKGSGTKRDGRHLLTTYGYARVSTTEEDLTIQVGALRKADCDVIREERRSGAGREGRAELETLLAFL